LTFTKSNDMGIFNELKAYICTMIDVVELIFYITLITIA